MSKSAPNGASLDLALSSEVRAEIGRRKASVKALAKAAGMSRERLSDRVNGRRAFSPNEMHAVGSALGLTAAELVARAEQTLTLIPPDFQESTDE